MRITLPTVAVCNGPALIRITLMRIQCGRMQHALLRIIVHIIGLVWTGLNTSYMTTITTIVIISFQVGTPSKTLYRVSV